jgi:SAM-dependent methyltransferase
MTLPSSLDAPSSRSRMSFAERVLLALSKEPGTGDYGSAVEDHKHSVAGALDMHQWAFPGFLERMRGKRIADFGCGLGVQAVALALEGAGHVFGVDTNEKGLVVARQLAAEHGVTDRVDFVARVDDRSPRFDVVISQDAFEHFDDPAGILRVMRSLVRPGGEIYIAFGPPWFAPGGSHMGYFTKVPWVNVLFPEEAVLAVRARFRDDGAKRYEDVAQGMNRMTVAKFEKIIAESGLEVRYRRYRAVKGIDVLTKIPFLREYFTNHVAVILGEPVK